jgi:hypothetical protein
MAMMELNVVLRGQSNAELLLLFGSAAAIQSKVAAYLGFNGTTNKVNLIATHDQPNGDNTINSGTSFLTQWLSAKDGNWVNGWTNNSLEQGFINELTSLPAAERVAPTAVLFVHNEYDSAVAALAPAEFESAVRYDAGQVRAALGQGAATTPYFFVDIPYGEGTDTGNQAIKQAQQSLAAAAKFNAHIGARASDLDMNWDLPNSKLSSFYGDGHMSPADANLLGTFITSHAAGQAQAFALTADWGDSGHPLANRFEIAPAAAPSEMPALHVGSINFDEVHSAAAAALHVGQHASFGIG